MLWAGVGTHEPARTAARGLLGRTPRRCDREEPRDRYLAPGDRVTGGLELCAIEPALLGDLPVRGMRVHHDREARRCGTTDGVRRGRGEPHRRVRPLQRLRQHLDPVAPEVFPLVGQAIGGPGAEDDVHRLLEAGGALLWRNPEGPELGAVEASSGSPVHPATGEDVEERDLLGEPERVVEGGERDRRADPEPPRARSIRSRSRSTSPAVATTQATSSMRPLSPAAPTTAHSRTASTPATTFSTSSGDTHCPETFSMSSVRPSTRKRPSALSTAWS